MNFSQPLPLYPTLNEIQEMSLDQYPDLNEFLNAEDAQPWRLQHWQWGLEYLRYIARNKSEHTYGRFRNETERFLLWVFMTQEKPIYTYRKVQILAYADFCWKPPVKWISLTAADRFVYNDGYFKTNSAWLPYRLKVAKNQQLTNPDKKKYKPSQQTLTAMFTGVAGFYTYLVGEEYCYGNPALLAKKDCRYFIADVQVKEVHRLTEEQWQYLLDTARTLATKSAVYERSLFVVATLKTLFLRISELSERKDWSPEMRHFWQDEHQHWWLKVFGKGRKLRDVSVPVEYLAYLKRYRAERALPPLPSSSDRAPIVEKIRGQGGMTARHLTRIVQEVFDVAYTTMKADLDEDAAWKLKEASTHWLRHTGASMEIERGRALKDLSEDLGHASMATTDTIYVQSEHRKRAESGKGRKVD